MVTFRPSDFFDLRDTPVEEQLTACEHVWDIVPIIDSVVRGLVTANTEVRGSIEPGAYVDPHNVYIDAGAIVESTAYIKGPCFIGAGAQVRHGAYIRGGVVLLEGAVLGHASEAKNSVLMREAKAPHFAYVGDSIIGNGVNLGAGTKLSNLGISNPKDANEKRRTIVIDAAGVRHDTGQSKLGAILGDDCQIGCNAVLNPGCFLGRGCLVYANTSVPRGYYEPNTILKLRQSLNVGARV